MVRKLTLAACLIVAGGISGSTVGNVFGQEVALEELYGRGVHRYFAGDYAKAYDELSMAIDGGITDPRAHYFRGLVLMATGRPDEARADWRVGARNESRQTLNAAVGRSLMRVQGPARLVLEQIRQSARIAAMSEAKIRNQARYGGPGAPAVERPAVPAVSSEVQVTAASSNPFREGAAATVEGAPSVVSANAFAETLQKSRADAAAIAEAKKPSQAPTGAAVAKPAASGNAGDPFGGDATPAANDPFGGGAGSAPAAGDPFGNF